MWVFGRCEENEREVGPTKSKIFTCRFVGGGLPLFPIEEATTKKKAKENAAKHLASHLLNHKAPLSIHPSAGRSKYYFDGRMNS